MVENTTDISWGEKKKSTNNMVMINFTTIIRIIPKTAVKLF